MSQSQVEPPTGEDPQQDVARSTAAPGDRARRKSLRVIGEIALIVLIFFLHSGWPPPEVNEAHYLGKARHYWDPSWCPRDLLMQSADAHLVFYWTFGWLTLLFPLPVVAWIGRILAWTLLAWSWRRLSHLLLPYPFVPVLTAAGMLSLLTWFHMAGEWIVGGVEAKSFAFPLVLLGFESLLAGRWRQVWWLLGAATSFHVLVGGWSLVAAAFVWSIDSERPALRRLLPSLLGGILLSLPGLIPALLLTLNAPSEISRRAAVIYVFYRLPHHLVFNAFADHLVQRFLGLVAAWIVLTVALHGLARRSAALPSGIGSANELPGRDRRQIFRAIATWLPAPSIAWTRLERLVLASLLLALVGVLINWTLAGHQALSAMLLRYYWFRLSDLMLPVGTALVAAGLVRELGRRWPRGAQLGWATLLLLSALGLGRVYYERMQWMLPGADRQSLCALAESPEEARAVLVEWQKMGEYVQEHTPPDALFLTPRLQQTFKWYAQRGEVVTWKDVPQDAKSLLEWRERMRHVHPRSLRRYGLTGHSDYSLRQLAEQYGAEYLVLDRRFSRRQPAFSRIYPPPGEAALFEVYRLREGEAPAEP